MYEKLGISNDIYLSEGLYGMRMTQPVLLDAFMSACLSMTAIEAEWLREQICGVGLACALLSWPISLTQSPQHHVNATARARLQVDIASFYKKWQKSRR